MTSLNLSRATSIAGLLTNSLVLLELIQASERHRATLGLTSEMRARGIVARWCKLVRISLSVTEHTLITRYGDAPVLVRGAWAVVPSRSLAEVLVNAATAITLLEASACLVAGQPTIVVDRELLFHTLQLVDIAAREVERELLKNDSTVVMVESGDAGPEVDTLGVEFEPPPRSSTRQRVVS